MIDSGVDYTHPDLAPNYAGGDDFVFLDGDPMDDHGHGTHVAGTIAAALDNLTGNPAEAEGVTGVAPNARILAYKVCRADGTCDDFAIQQAIARAVADGANVINMSLGESEYSQSLNDAVQDAWNAGVVIVAGAGNDGTTAPFYPAAFDNVVSVAAFDEDHRRPSFSNYGSWVDISAPGNVIMSTYPMAACDELHHARRHRVLRVEYRDVDGDAARRRCGSADLVTKRRDQQQPGSGYPSEQRRRQRRIDRAARLVDDPRRPQSPRCHQLWIDEPPARC